MWNTLLAILSWFLRAFLEQTVISGLPIEQGHRANLPILGSSIAGSPTKPGRVVGKAAIAVPFQTCDARLQLPRSYGPRYAGGRI